MVEVSPVEPERDLRRTLRLQKFLAECGVASRREAETIIAAGGVEVNGVPATLGDSVDPDTDVVTLNGEALLRDEKVYVVLHKPKGVVTSVKDTHDRKTVLDCVSGAPARIVPVGRLDMDVSGVLILTNDGELTYRLTHPSYEVDKVYLAWVGGVMSPETACELEQGITLDDGPTAPGSVRIVKTAVDSTLIQLTIHEGRNRLVKRMCAAVGHPVHDLRRVSIGGVRIEGLSPGEWRYLSRDEVEALRALTGLGQ